ncbi:MAG: FitA-like ribbon-helix-helix domain-containing protein [Paracoccaceae bacterium]
MPDLTVPNIPDQVFTALQSIAAKHRLSIEEYAKHLLCDAVALASLEANVDISIGKLLDNFDAYLRIAESQNVLFADERGRRFALVPIAKIERMSAPLASDASQPLPD